MIWETILSKIVGTLPEKVVDYYAKKRELKHSLKLAKIKGKIAIQKAKDERAAKEQQHTHDWEMSYIRLQKGNPKDEIVLFVFLWPFVGVFIPGVQDYVLRGFDYLREVPPFWAGITVAISLAIYGIRHRNANKINAPGLRDQDVK